MKSLTAVLPDVIDELRAAVPDYIHTKEDGAYRPGLYLEKGLKGECDCRMDNR